MPDYAVKDPRTGLTSCAYLRIDTDAAKDGLLWAFRCMAPNRDQKYSRCLTAWQDDCCPCKDEIISHRDMQEPPYK